MSVETALAMEAAIEAHISDETGDLTAGYVLVAEITSIQELDDDESSFYKVTRGSQSRFTTDGLLWAALNME